MNFTEQLNEVGIVLNDTQRSQFDKYFEILVEWNVKKCLLSIF